MSISGLPSANLPSSSSSGLDLEAAIARQQAAAAAAQKQSAPSSATPSPAASAPDPTSPVTSGATLNTFPTSDAPTAFDNAQEELAAADAEIAPRSRPAPPNPAPAASPEVARTAQPEVVAPPRATQAPVAIARPAASVEQVTRLQSAAVKDYFASRWKPPVGLKQPLQYQLILSGEGSIERMNPLSPAATQYADQAGIPDVGEAFIAPSTGIQDSTVVLTLGADGKVEVSVENVTPQ